MMRLRTDQSGGSALFYDGPGGEEGAVDLATLSVELPPSGCADFTFGDDVLRVGRIAAGIILTPLRGTLVNQHGQEQTGAQMIVIGIEGTISDPASLRWKVTVLPEEPATMPLVYRA
jgi:hypothetical protein